MSGTIIAIGMSPTSPAPSMYCFHTGVMCAPASSKTSSTPRSRASFTPQVCMLSPRTRSANSVLASSTVTPTPARASANAKRRAADPATDDDDIRRMSHDISSVLGSRTRYAGRAYRTEACATAAQQATTRLVDGPRPRRNRHRLRRSGRRDGPRDRRHGRRGVRARYAAAPQPSGILRRLRRWAGTRSRTRTPAAVNVTCFDASTFTAPAAPAKTCRCR